MMTIIRSAVVTFCFVVPLLLLAEHIRRRDCERWDQD